VAAAGKIVNKSEENVYVNIEDERVSRTRYSAQLYSDSDEIGHQIIVYLMLDWSHFVYTCITIDLEQE
jgi:hypothetical protein